MNMKFTEGSTVQHRKGSSYTILFTPDVCRIEATGRPGYGYRSTGSDPTVWVREAEEMEDGRFVEVPNGRETFVGDATVMDTKKMSEIDARDLANYRKLLGLIRHELHPYGDGDYILTFPQLSVRTETAVWLEGMAAVMEVALNPPWVIPDA